MGKKNQYVDDYMGDVASIRKRHKKIRVLMAALCTAGVVAAGSATYVLMNPAQTMTKEGIDEMDPNEDYVVKDEDNVTADDIRDEKLKLAFEAVHDLSATPDGALKIGFYPAKISNLTRILMTEEN